MDYTDKQQSEIEVIEGIKVRSFNNCPFKVMLPRLDVRNSKAEISFKLQTKPEFDVDVVLDEIYLSDEHGHNYDQFFECEWKPKNVRTRDFRVTIPIDNGGLSKPDTSIVLFLLASNQKSYEVCYQFVGNDNVKLEYVMDQEISRDESLRLRQAFQQVVKKAVPSSEIDTSNSNAKASHLVPTLEEYKNALLREKYYLQEEGGRKHKVTNGRRLNSGNGWFSYSFEIETELNLTDDAPVTLYYNENNAAGNVLVCEGFEIVIIVDKDFGDKVPVALLAVEPWKLLEALVNKLDQIDSSNRIAMKLTEEGPKLATKNPPSAIPKGQDEAIKAVRKNDITVIWGPPGTGKTHTMAQIAIEYLNNKSSVLIVSHSNVSVDGSINKIVELLKDGDNEQILEAGEVLRYGYVRDETLAKNDYATAYNYALKRRSDLKQRLKQLAKEKQQLKNEGNYYSDKRDRIEKELKGIRAAIRADERQYVSNAKIVATTISKVTVDSLFDDKMYDIVMFDEVSMAYVPQIICAASFAEKKIVLVGDFRQLAPIVQSEVKEKLEKDIFSYLGINNGTRPYAHPWLVMLNEQWRMYPAISAFANQTVYSRQLKDNESVIGENEDAIKKEPLSGNPINLINLTGTYCATMKNNDNSRFNIISAIIAFTTALQAEVSGEDNIGIITPYAAQTRLIRAMMKDHGKGIENHVSCSTIHQFQGSERNLIIFDAVESYPAIKVGWLMGKEMESVSRLINVAITRAKGKLITIANAKFWENRFGDSQHIFWRLVEYLQSKGNVVGVKNKTLEPYIHQLPVTKNIHLYKDMDHAMHDFESDVKKAQSIIISIPDGNLDPDTEDIIIRIINNAKGRGVQIRCKTNGYRDLPDKWKEIAFASENAVFPIILMDNDVIWYGIPKSLGEFRDGKSGYRTVCQTVYRIRGKYTIDIITNFSDLDMRVVEGQKRALSEKTETSFSQPDSFYVKSANKDGFEPTGIDRFVREMVKCPKCKNPMTVTRSRKGAVYLKCSSRDCKQIDYLTKETTNWYIDREHVTCPEHHCGIHAAVGRYGIYVRCDKGHNLKADEI